MTEPVVQARLIGAFAEKDTLVLLAFRTRNFLGKKGSSAWNEVLAACDAVWREIFGLHPRMRANAIGDYVSSNYDPFKLNR